MGFCVWKGNTCPSDDWMEDGYCKYPLSINTQYVCESLGHDWVEPPPEDGFCAWVETNECTHGTMIDGYCQYLEVLDKADCEAYAGFEWIPTPTPDPVDPDPDPSVKKKNP